VRETQTFSFAAWIFAHIFLAFISRSDKESVFSLGVFGNPAINLWMMTAIAFLLLGIYVPFLGGKLAILTVGFPQLIMVALATGLIVGSLELRKMIHLNRSRR
jgi:Ca2+-transporting ATPase